MRIAIIADDLTGATDSAAPFATRGVSSAAVMVGSLIPSGAQASFDVISISTETRDLPSPDRDKICMSVSSAFAAATNWGAAMICKKIDSTLRGHPSFEVGELCANLPGRTPIICPAFPAQGRHVVNGSLIVGGRVQCQVAEHVVNVARRDLFSLTLADVQQGADHVRTILQQITGRPGCNIIADAQTDSDLAVLAAALVPPERWLPVGSAGLLGALAGQFGAEQPDRSYLEALSVRMRSIPMIFVLGSRTARTRSQIDALVQVAQILPTSTVGAALEQIHAGARVAVAAAPANHFPAAKSDGSAALEQDRHKVLENLLKGCDRLTPEVTVIASGGATAAALLTRLNRFSHLRILGEVEPGIAYAVVSCKSSQHHGIDLVLKSGGFGDELTLARCAGL